MRVLAEKQSRTQEPLTPHPTLNLQRTIANQFAPPPVHANTYDFSRIPVYSKTSERLSGSSDHEQAVAPAMVHEALASPGRPLDAETRSYMEPRFGYDFSRVRVHSDAAAHQSARDVHSHAYTVGHDIVFGAGRFALGTQEGRRLLAHELAHVVQQSQTDGVRSFQSPLSYASSVVIQREPDDETTPDCRVESECQTFVKEGKWCRDTEQSGRLHPGQQCYREIPPAKGFHSAKQSCFDKKTRAFVEPSPDYISVVNGQNADGTCDIGYIPHPFSQRGLRTAGHLIADVATEDPDKIGLGFGILSGVMMGIALPKEGLDPVLGNLLVPAILGSVAGLIGTNGLPVLRRVTKKYGFLPTISLSAGSNIGLGLGVGFEKRDRPLPFVPINTYLTLGFDSTLAGGGESAPSSTFLAKVGVRIDPGRQGGLFAVGTVGAGLATRSDISGVTSRELGVGYRATDFLDVQMVRETVSGEGSGDTTYWVTLRLVAPQSALKEHPK